MGEAKRRRDAVERLLAQEEQSRAGIAPTLDDDLPPTHYDQVKLVEPQVFAYIARDLKRLADAPGWRVQDLLPPVRDSQAEIEYATLFLQHVARDPRSFGISTPEAARTLADVKTREYRSLLAYEASGRKTYYFFETLTEGLSYTALTVPAEMLRLPVDGACFVYKSDVATELLHLITGKPITPEDLDSTITVYLREDELPEYGFRRLLITVFQTHGLRQLGYFARSLALRPGWTLEQALQTDWKKIAEQEGNDLYQPAVNMRTTADDAEGPSWSEGDMEAFLDDGVRFFRMVVNSILYVTSRNALMASRLSNRPVRFVQGGTRAVEHQRRDVQYQEVGRDIESIPVIIDPLKQYTGDTPSTFADKRRLQVRFMVPGFYRRAPGSAPEALPSVWVRPHYRGPEIADLLNRPYVVR